MSKILTLPEHHGAAPTIRAKALVFHDPASIALLAQADRVAASEATVLIFGETGTGKELLARHIHTASGRTGPFIAVNCGALSENLVEAELFGHEAGAYTGATHSRAGWFEAAQHGTLFLDEIGDLPMAMQVKLLRVLQERQVVRVGSRRPIDIDVRLVAATNVDLAQAVEAGHFRRDLYYRLNIATLQLPPLADRPADILALARHFIALYSKRLGQGPVRLSEGAERALLAHPWPGNIRELENVIHYALIVGRGEEIDASALNLRQAAARPVAAAPAQVIALPTSTPATTAEPGQGTDTLHPALRQALRSLIEAGGPDLYARIEREAIVAAYEFCHRNQVHTAALLGITRNVLRAQLKRFGLLPDRGRQATNESAPLANALVSTDDTATDTLHAAPSLNTGDLTPCAA